MSSHTPGPGQPGTSVDVNPDPTVALRHHDHASLDEPGACPDCNETARALAETRLNAHAIRCLFDAVDRRDRAGVMAAYDADIVIHEAASLPYGGDHRGHAGALSHGLGFRTAWDRFQPHDKRGLEPQIIADGNHVAVLWRHRGENADTGDKIDLPAVSIYRMRNGKIVDSRMFHFDTAALLRFLDANTLGRMAAQATARSTVP